MTQNLQRSVQEKNTIYSDDCVNYLLQIFMAIGEYSCRCETAF